MIIMKFGGSSVKDAPAMEKSISIVRSRLSKPPVVVLSACSGITDKLLNLIRLSARQPMPKLLPLLNEIEHHHTNLVTDLIKDDHHRKIAFKHIEALIDVLKNLVEGVNLLKECTPRSQDFAVSFGELFSTLIFETAMKSMGIDSVWVDARTAIKTDSNFTMANVDFPKTAECSKNAILKYLENGTAVVTQGFIGSNEQGITTTLGRGGSDYSAAILGQALSVEAIEIWTDVSGILSTDPRIVPGAKTIPEMSYPEVRELAFFGAKVLHPDTILPAVSSGIPVVVLNTFEPKSKGTRIVGKLTKKKAAIRSLALKNNCTRCLLEIPKDVNPQLFGASVLKAFGKKNIQVLNFLQGDTDCRILTEISPDNFRKVFKTELKDTIADIIECSVICMAGINLSTSEGALISAEATKLLAPFNPYSVIYGTTDISIIAILPSSEAIGALKELHGKMMG